MNSENQSLLRNSISKITELLKNKRFRNNLYGALIILSLIFVSRALINNWSELAQQEWDIDFRFIGLATLLYPIGMLPTVAAWHFLLRAINIKLAFATNLRFYSLSALPRHIPGLVWYVSSRSLLYQDIGVSGSRILVASGLEAVFLTLTGCITSLLWFSITRADDPRFLPVQIAALIAALVIMVFLFWTPAFNKILAKLQSRWEIQEPIQIEKKEMILSLVWMFMAWVGGGVLLFILARGFLPIDWSALPSMIGIWGAAGAISLSLGALIQGMGLREITLAVLLSSTIPMLFSVVISIAFRLTLTVGEILWVAIFSWITKAPSDHSEGAQKNS